MWEKEKSLLMSMSNFFFPTMSAKFLLYSFLEKNNFHIDLHPCFLGKEAQVGAMFIFSYCLDLKVLKKICLLEIMFLLKINP